MKRKAVLNILLISIFAILFTACTDGRNDKPLIYEFKDAANNANVKIEEILHIEAIQDGVLVFYVRDNALHAGFIRKTSKNWAWVTGGGSSSLKPEKPLNFHGSNFKEVPLYITYGCISDNNIYKLEVEQNDKEKNATIIKNEDGIRLWYVIWNEPAHAPAKYTAYSANGEILYKVD